MHTGVKTSVGEKKKRTDWNKTLPQVEA